MNEKTKNQTERRTLTALIAARLDALGASTIPPRAREYIERDVLAACAALVERRVTAPFIGRAVARSLAASAAKTEGFEGGVTPPSTSEPSCKRSAQIGIAGQPTDAPDNQPNAAASGAQEPPTGERP
ncbi:MAG TPA: hypothetical protein VN873_04110 [Candidatus Angelobacter sp.]|nr:hypothetical protein [Candidatus Angelobacter sp.]